MQQALSIEIKQPLYGAGRSDRPSVGYYEIKLKSCQSKTLEDGDRDKEIFLPSEVNVKTEYYFERGT